MGIKEHYDGHLANYYTWIYGGFEKKAEDNKIFFSLHDIKPTTSKIVIDLGAGSGFQSIPLLDLGFEVISVDISQKLLKELRSRTINNTKLSIIESDILEFKSYNNRRPELIICMGDTLTHLAALSSVQVLLENCHKELLNGGKLILTFRDLTNELQGINRFIPVKSEEGRIFICFLEYSPEYIDVYDIVNELKDGIWVQKISSYKKIKISPDTIKKYLIDLKFEINYFEVNKGLITVIAKKNRT